MPINTTKPIDRSPILVDLALQGGGAHGAFTWGVLDRFLEEPWLEIDGVSGTSAGAMNAAVMIHGHQIGGRAGARAALETFWRRVSAAARFSPFQRGPLDVMLGRWTLNSSPLYVAMDLMSRLVSPYTINPMGKNPLREILAELIDFDVSGALADPSLHHRHQRAHRTRKSVQERRRDARRPARFGLPADDVPGGRDRRRGLLGRRVLRQSDAHSADPRVQVAGHDPHSDQSDRTPGGPAQRGRYPQPPERGVVQRGGAEGAEDDGASAQGRRSWRRRGEIVERDARACREERRHGQAWRIVEAQRRMVVLHLPARRGERGG